MRGGTTALLAIACALTLGCGGNRDAPRYGAAAGPPAAEREWFSDVAEASGLHFVHFNGMSGDRTMPEILGPGVALFDYDNDGDLDVFVVQGQLLGAGKTLSEARVSPQMPVPLTARLYRNDLEVHPDGTRSLHFTDVTEQSGIGRIATGYGMGVATGDFDNDGFTDLYLTSFGANQLLHNNGDGTFTDVSKKSGTAVSGWSVSAAFLDYDRDGWLDLYVGSYLRYSVESATKCFSPSGAVDYCTPNSYRPLPGRLFHNNRDGTFTDVTAKARIASEFGPALGVSTADFNGDGWIDLYVANDSQPNQLWINQHDGTFKNTALLAGAALTQEGKAEASMGVDAGDFDNDGDEDSFITEQTGEGHNLFVNDGAGNFEDQSSRSGLAATSLGYTGFGTAWFDFDNDGWLDLLTVSGAVQTIQALAQARDPFPLHQRKQLFRNLGNGHFEDVTASAGAVFRLSEVGRGAAFGDIDNDGDTDVVIANNNGPLRLLLNNVGNRKHWIGLRLVANVRGPERAAPHVGRPFQGRQVRDMLGARVEDHPQTGTRNPKPRTSTSLASRSRRRQLRVGQRSACTGRPRRVLADANDSRPVAGWPDRRMAERRDRSLHNIDGARRPMMSRRRFLGLAGLAALAGASLPRLASAAWQAAAPVSAPLFVEVPSSASGITWVHDNAMSAQRFLPESLGPGCAFLDYDNDGWMDIYLVNSGPSNFFQPARPLKNALYRNNRDGTFTDVTDKAGVAGGTFGMGVAVGDYDNDGFPDMFVTAYGRPILYRNNADGTFTDVTERAGLTSGMPGWTTGAVWFDYDNDGRLDLFVGSYVEYDLRQGLLCAEKKKDGGLYYHYCIPHLFKPTASVLWHNNGDGTFTQASRDSIGRSPGKSLGAVATDINNDGLMDLVVANDTSPNFLFLNRGKNVWQENGVAAGIAYSASGNLRSGMGVDAADLNGDGWQDLFVANIDHEMFSLYESHKGAFFTDAAADHGVAQATRLLSGWGLKFCDFDNDGHIDLLLANGHPDDTIALRAPDVHYKEPLLYFRNDGRRLRNVSQQAGPVFAKSFAARGLAVGDYDNDGRVDVLVGCNGDAPVLLRNNAGSGNQANHWVGVKLQGVRCNRDAIGARLTWSAGGVRRSRQKNGGGSYLSAHDPREVLGLGRAVALDWLEIKWPGPSSTTERVTNIPVDRYVTIVEGKGIVA